MPYEHVGRKDVAQFYRKGIWFLSCIYILLAVHINGCKSHNVVAGDLQVRLCNKRAQQKVSVRRTLKCVNARLPCYLDDSDSVKGQEHEYVEVSKLSEASISQ
jgi:hypothetical protein